MFPDYFVHYEQICNQRFRVLLAFIASPKIYETSFFTTTNYFPLLIGSNYEFICRADGKPTPSVLWLLNEQVNSSGPGSAVLKINNVQKSINSEKYICRAINIDGMDEKEMTLFVPCMNIFLAFMK